MEDRAATPRRRAVGRAGCRGVDRRGGLALVGDLAPGPLLHRGRGGFGGTAGRGRRPLPAGAASVVHGACGWKPSGWDWRWAICRDSWCWSFQFSWCCCAASESKKPFCGQTWESLTPGTCSARKGWCRWCISVWLEWVSLWLVGQAPACRGNTPSPGRRGACPTSQRLTHSSRVRKHHPLRGSCQNKTGTALNPFPSRNCRSFACLHRPYREPPTLTPGTERRESCTVKVLCRRMSFLS